jgi:hypothetical protein
LLPGVPFEGSVNGVAVRKGQIIPNLGRLIEGAHRDAPYFVVNDEFDTATIDQMRS